jgi:plastocyanin
MRRAITLAAAGAALLVTSACSGSSDPEPATASLPGATVTIPLLAFDPATVTIAPGQTVTWKNGNDISHVLVERTYTVGADGLRTSETPDGAFSLKVDNTGDTVSHTYPKAGTFTYYCSIHKGMNATVTVK